MFLLKWFTSPSSPFSPTTVIPENLEIPKEGEVTIMDMPDLVIRKILKDVDFVSMLNLRKVNRAFQNFIDDTHQIQFNLKWLFVEIDSRCITMKLYEHKPNNKNPSKICFHGFDEDCVITTPTILADILELPKIRGSTFKDQFGICLDGILKNQKGTLEILYFQHEFNLTKKPSTFSGSIFGCCTSSKRSVEDFDATEMVTNSVLDSLEKVFQSNKIRIEGLKIERFKLEQVTRLISILKPEMLDNLLEYQISKNKKLKKIVERCDLVMNLYKLETKSDVSESHRIFFKKLTAQDLFSLKEILLESGPSTPLIIKFSQISRGVELKSVFGDPSSIGFEEFFWIFDYSKKWKLKMRVHFSRVMFEWIDAGFFKIDQDFSNFFKRVRGS